VQIGADRNWKLVDAGSNHTVATRNDDTLWAWGDNSFGQLGDGTTTGRNAPAQVGTATWSAISAGGNHTAGVRAGGTMWAWGRNVEGQLGDGTTTNRLSPVQVGVLTDWGGVTAGTAVTIGLRER
jgi:alpha-tubulin suppressor-like RCC1 family protein